MTEVAKQRFQLGQIVITPGAMLSLKIANQEPFELLFRHAAGDWGALLPEDIKANNDALQQGDRLLSAYFLKTGIKIWVITEYDRSVTTLLLPSEY